MTLEIFLDEKIFANSFLLRISTGKKVKLSGNKDSRFSIVFGFDRTKLSQPITLNPYLSAS